MTSRCRMSRWAAAAAAASIVIALQSSWAQQATTGSIGGRVTDASAAALPGASVTVTSGQGSRSYATDSGGRFLAPYLTPGLYRVRVELAGFVSAERSEVEVRLGGEPRGQGSGLNKKEAEQEAARAALAAVGGNRRAAAERLGIGLRTLYDKLKRYRLEGGA